MKCFWCNKEAYLPNFAFPVCFDHLMLLVTLGLCIKMTQFDNPTFKPIIKDLIERW